MTRFASLLDEHRAPLTATLRRTFSTSLYDVETPSQWREVLDLVEVALADPSTHLCAAVQGWAYPVAFHELFMLGASTGKSFENVAPWSPRLAAANQASLAEVEQAREELDSIVTFT